MNALEKQLPKEMLAPMEFVRKKLMDSQWVFSFDSRNSRLVNLKDNITIALYDLNTGTLRFNSAFEKEIEEQCGISFSGLEIFSIIDIFFEIFRVEPKRVYTLCTASPF